MPLPAARPTRLVSRNVPKSSGNNDTTSIRTFTARRQALDPLDPRASKDHLVSDRIDEVVDERELHRASSTTRPGAEPHHQHVGGWIGHEILDDANLAGRTD